MSVGEADFVCGEKGHRELVACGGGYAGRLKQAQAEIRTFGLKEKRAFQEPTEDYTFDDSDSGLYFGVSQRRDSRERNQP